MPSITKPTRFTSKSSTLIDNIIFDLKPLFNSISDVKSGLLISDVADNLHIFHLSDFYHIIFKKTYQINDNSLSKLSEVLSNTQWNDLTDVCDATYCLRVKFSQIYND